VPGDFSGMSVGNLPGEKQHQGNISSPYAHIRFQRPRPVSIRVLAAQKGVLSLANGPLQGALQISRRLRDARLHHFDLLENWLSSPLRRSGGKDQ
jgi:hypothetical protein